MQIVGEIYERLSSSGCVGTDALGLHRGYINPHKSVKATGFPKESRAERLVFVNNESKIAQE
jgi:hypothetical protein